MSPTDTAPTLENAPETVRRPARRPRSRSGVAAAPPEWLRWIVPALLLLAWQLASSMGWLNPRVLPAPSAIGGALWELLLSGKLAEHFLVSLGRALVGVSIGAGLGFALGLLNGTQRTAHTLLDSTLQMVRTVPSLALIPLVILWFGVGEAGKYFLIALATFFPVYINTLHGVQGIDPKLLEMGRVYGLSPWALFRRVLLPGALPSVLVGLRYALGISWLALVVSESFGAQSGIGFLAMEAREFFRTDVIVLSILIYALIGKTVDSLVRLLERRWLPWHTGLNR